MSNKNLMNAITTRKVGSGHYQVIVANVQSGTCLQILADAVRESGQSATEFESYVEGLYQGFLNPRPIEEILGGRPVVEEYMGPCLECGLIEGCHSLGCSLDPASSAQDAANTDVPEKVGEASATRKSETKQYLEVVNLTNPGSTSPQRAESMEEANEIIHKNYERTPKMSDENWEHWSSQIYGVQRVTKIIEPVDMATGKVIADNPNPSSEPRPVRCAICKQDVDGTTAYCPKCGGRLEFYTPSFLESMGLPAKEIKAHQQEVMAKTPVVNSFCDCAACKGLFRVDIHGTSPEWDALFFWVGEDWPDAISAEKANEICHFDAEKAAGHENDRAMADEYDTSTYELIPEIETRPAYPVNPFTSEPIYHPANEPAYPPIGQGRAMAKAQESYPESSSRPLTDGEIAEIVDEYQEGTMALDSLNELLGFEDKSEWLFPDADSADDAIGQRNRGDGTDYGVAGVKDALRMREREGYGQTDAPAKEGEASAHIGGYFVKDIVCITLQSSAFGGRIGRVADINDEGHIKVEFAEPGDHWFWPDSLRPANLEEATRPAVTFVACGCSFVGRELVKPCCDEHDGGADEDGNDPEYERLLDTAPETVLMVEAASMPAKVMAQIVDQAVKAYGDITREIAGNEIAYKDFCPYHNKPLDPDGQCPADRTIPYVDLPIGGVPVVEAQDEDETYALHYSDIDIVVDRQRGDGLEIRVWRNGKDDQNPWARFEVDNLFLDDEVDEDGQIISTNSCDICHKSGITIGRTTLNGQNVCEADDCQAEADRIDSQLVSSDPLGGK